MALTGRERIEFVTTAHVMFSKLALRPPLSRAYAQLATLLLTENPPEREPNRATRSTRIFHERVAFHRRPRMAACRS